MSKECVFSCNNLAMMYGKHNYMPSQIWNANEFGAQAGRNLGAGGGIVFAYLSKHLCTSLSNFNSDILANHGNLGYNPSLHYKPINSTPPFNMLITPHRKPPNIHSINHTTMCNTINKYTFESNPFLPIWLQPWYTPTSNNQPSQLPQKPSTPSCPPPPHA